VLCVPSGVCYVRCFMCRVRRGVLWYVYVVVCLCCGMFCCAIGINNDEMGMFLWCSLPNQYGMCVCHAVQF
jgi:hypothetical protein